MRAPDVVLALLLSALIACSRCCVAEDQDRSDDDRMRPNIVFLVVESTDGRTWTPGYSDDAIPLPNIRALQKEGVEFRRHYSNAPVCCPSRATFWSGRHASNIPHEHFGVRVDGAWNNYEGLPSNFSNRMDQILSRGGYNVKMSGKTDWDTGGHSENVYLNAWTMNVQFPYDVNRSGGWSDETMCGDNATIAADRKIERHSDWATVHSTTEWIRKNANASAPFFAYQGMNIVHPPYVTNRYWFDKIDTDRVQVPEWVPLAEMHPCDFQSSMLKGCVPSDAEAEQFYSVERRREIRAVYFAMIAEFDAMVGAYVDAVRGAGVWNRTVFIVTSDHGDMQMHRQQFYKMVPYEASASVPMVILDGRDSSRGGGGVVIDDAPTQLIDIFPTVMDLAKIPARLRPETLDGHSLVPLLTTRVSNFDDDDDDDDNDDDDARPNFVVTQFHGDNIAMSWFAIVQRTSASQFFKLVVWGTGEEVPSMLFDLNADPDETQNLYGDPQYDGVVSELLDNLRSVVDFPSVATNVAQYNKQMFLDWTNRTSDWEDEIHKSSLRWDASWNVNASASLDAVREWMHSAAAARPTPCRHSLRWPQLTPGH